MKPTRQSRGYWAIALLVTFALGLPAQSVPPVATLVVSGVDGEAKTITIDGKLYVDVEAISRLLGATWETREGRAILSLPGSSPGAESTEGALSRPLVVSGIELITTVREWRYRLIDATVHSYPFLEDLAASYQRRTDTQLAAAGANAATAGDRQVLEMLTSEVNLMRRFSAKYVERRRTSSGVFPEEIENDATGLQILACAKGLASLTVTHESQDVPSCHE